MDIYKWTDQELASLERKINAEYTKAYKEIKAQIAQIQANPNMTLAQKTVQINKLDNLCSQLAEILQDTNKTAASWITSSMANIYKTNYNFTAKEFGFTLLDNTAVKNILTEQVNPFAKLSMAAGADKSVITRKLKSELTTSILKGDSITEMARRMKTVSEGYLKDTIRIARTETTRVENSAHQSIGDEGKRLGFNMYKQWVATPDNRTRDEHLHADGQEVPNDEPFDVGGEQLMYPGDESLGASGWNTINCRCRIKNIIKRKGE